VCLVDTTIGAAADETDDFVLVGDLDLALVADGPDTAVGWICGGYALVACAGIYGTRGSGDGRDNGSNEEG